VNRQAAALIGLARLARMSGNEEWQHRAAAELARVLAHRFAVGKYTGWLYEQALLAAPKGFSPADDPREVAVSEEHAVLGYGSNQRGPLPYFNDEEGPYTAMVPELARFCADHLKPQAEDFARATAAHYPDAFLTLGAPRRPAEWWHNYPRTRSSSSSSTPGSWAKTAIGCGDTSTCPWCRSATCTTSTSWSPRLARTVRPHGRNDGPTSVPLRTDPNGQEKPGTRSERLLRCSSDAFP